MSGARARPDPGLWARLSGGTTLLGVMLTASACALSSGVAPVEGGPGPVADPGAVGALFRAPVAAPAVPPPLMLAPVGTSDPGPAVPGAAVFTDAPPAHDRVRIAITFAMAQIGLPYVWGGNGPAAGHAGFDCSGLTTAAYAAAGITLPRTAHTQYYAGPHVPAGAPLQPGDLVFYGVPSRVHHVGLYIGDGRMVAAPTFGKPVQLAYVRWRGDDYLGATRPAAQAGSLRHGLLPPAPLAPAPPPVDGVFAAPPAPPGPAVLPGGPVPPGPAATQPPAPMAEGGADPAPPGPTPSTTPTPTPTPPTPPAPIPPGTTPPETSPPPPTSATAPTPTAPTSVPPSSAAPSPTPAPETEPAPASAAAVQPAATSTSAGTTSETTAAPAAP